MKLHQLTVYNFGPYRGEQRLSFSTNPEQPVMVVFGDNMRGKTSLMNSLRWVLYGRAVDRHSKQMEMRKLLNTDAVKEGDGRFWVQLEFEADGDRYDLRRTAELSDLVSEPRSDSDFRTSVMLTKNGDVVKSDEIEHHINRFIPEQISRFYLFDGELLQEYETLLSEESDQGKRIKGAIEQVLGVPALTNGRDEIRDLLKKAQAVQAKEFKHVKALEDQSSQSLRLQEEIRAHKEDLLRAETGLADANVKLDAINDEMGQIAPIQEIQRSLQRSENELVEARNRQTDLEKHKFSILRSAWKDLLQPRLTARRVEIATKIQQYEDKIKRKGSLEDTIAKIDKLLHTSTCPLCGTEIGPHRKEEFGKMLGDARAEMHAFQLDAKTITNLTREMTILSGLTGTGAAATLRNNERDSENNSIRMTRLENELEGFKESLRGHDIARVAQIQREKEGLLRLRAKYEMNTESISALIEEKTSRVDQLAKLMSRNPEARKQRSSREVELYGALAQIFGKSIDHLRENLREKVAAEATTVFRQLTTEKTYRGLRINNNYGLTIIDRHGRDVSVRSAGAEQVVAMSLLSALNRTASRPGPVIIDTPFGRLDPKHRWNIMDFVPKMAEQVVFLVHEGELNRGTDLKRIEPAVGAVYEIERVSSSHSLLKACHSV
jgi:DNA sulfur modification protein DndD